MAVLLVRHAEAGDRDRWEGPDRVRPLSAEGEGQAAGLVDLLEEFTVARVMSSPYLRCMQTLEPLAAARGRAVEACDDLAEGGGTAALDLVRRLSDAPDGDAVLCTHGDVMENLLDGLGIHRSEETEKGATWVIGPGAAARYLPPPA
jgi:phosphohistidine phosphatase SixA